MKPTKIEFSVLNNDGSGTDYAVRYDLTQKGNEIEMESVDTITFSINNIDFLIDSLCEIRDICVYTSDILIETPSDEIISDFESTFNTSPKAGLAGAIGCQKGLKRD